MLDIAERKAVKNRLHVDLRADGAATPDELKPLLSLGARRVDIGQGPDVSWVVLGDRLGPVATRWRPVLDRSRPRYLLCICPGLGVHGEQRIGLKVGDHQTLSEDGLWQARPSSRDRPSTPQRLAKA